MQHEIFLRRRESSLSGLAQLVAPDAGPTDEAGEAATPRVHVIGNSCTRIALESRAVDDAFELNVQRDATGGLAGNAVSSPSDLSGEIGRQ